MSASLIFHVDMDAFFVSVEEVLDPSLRGKPVVVGAQPGHRGVVAAASYEARKYGIHSAMPVSEAVRLCPHAIFLPGHSGLYSKYSHQVHEIFCRYSPIVEMVSIDEGYLDMTGAERMFFSGGALARARDYEPDAEALEERAPEGGKAAAPSKAGRAGERPLAMSRDPRNLLGISVVAHADPSTGQSRYAFDANSGVLSKREMDIHAMAHPEVKTRPSLDESKQPLPAVRGLLDADFFMMSVAARLREEILRQTGLSASIGIGMSRLIAKVASDMAKTRGLLMVAPGREAAFLAPLTVRRLPGIGPKTEQQLNDLGVTTVGDLQKFDVEFLREHFGAWGESLALKAQGRSDWRFYGDDDPKSISHENTFAVDTTDREEIEATLVYLIQRVGKRLRDHRLYASTIQLKLRDSKFKTITRATSLAEPTDIDAVILKNGLALLQSNWNGQTPIRLIGINVSNLTDRPPQRRLIEEEHPGKLEKLYQAADSIREKYGFDSLKAARGEGRKKRNS